MVLDLKWGGRAEKRRLVKLKVKFKQWWVVSECVSVCECVCVHYVNVATLIRKEKRKKNLKINLKNKIKQKWKMENDEISVFVYTARFSLFLRRLYTFHPILHHCVCLMCSKE